MKIKTSEIEKAFLLGVGFHYLATRPCGFYDALRKALRSQQRYYERESKRVVDPYNRDVVE